MGFLLATRAWWLDEMRSLVADLAPRRAETTAIDGVVLDQRADGQIVVAVRQRAHCRQLCAMPPDESGVAAFRQCRRGFEKLPVIVHVPLGRVLQREVALPLAAERDVGAALGYMIEDITPFAAKDMIWSWRIIHRNAALGTITALLRVLPTAPLRPLLDFLAAQAIAVSQFEITTADGARQSIIPSSITPRTERKAIAAGLLALLAIAVTLPFGLQRRAISQAEARIAELRPAALAAARLQRRLGGDAAGIATGRLPGSQRSPLAIIADLTDILPDDAWLTALSLRAAKVEFSGEAADPARLIAALAKRPGFRNPAFSAPVTRAVNGRGDIFSIVADFGR